MIASGAALTNAAARWGRLSSVASKPPGTTVRFFPSINPLSRSSSKRASTAADCLAEGSIKPSRYVRLFSCARAASGLATAPPPRSRMTSRRLMSSIGLAPRLSAAKRGWEVLGTDLNCSESGWRADPLPCSHSNDSTHGSGRALHCRISVLSLSALGQSRPRKSKPGDHPCPLGPESEGRPSRRDYVAERPLRTLRRRKTFDRVVGPEKEELGPDRT